MTEVITGFTNTSIHHWVWLNVRLCMCSFKSKTCRNMKHLKLDYTLCSVKKFVQTTLINNRHTDVGSTLQWIITGYRRQKKTFSKPIMIRWVEAFTHYLMNCDYIHGQRIVVKMAHIRRTHIWMLKSNSHLKSYHIIWGSWWIMADDNWSAKRYSIQFQVIETSNQSNCVVSTLSNDDLTLTKWSFSATIHQSHSLACSLPLTHSPHLTSPHLNSTQRQRNATQSMIQSDYSLIH